ncbi:phage tail protein [Actinobacillus suis]|uniref:phage tail protein n=1 Tax=Actinobacillus suis TaxID=716 RepID=UPI000E311D1C|nr:phage tail protein [Actinobacillus suis]
MAKLTYPDVIRNDVKFTALADLASRLDTLDKSQIMTSIIELMDDKYIELLAEKWSVTGYDGYLLADNIKAKRSLISTAVELHKYKGTPWAVKQICLKLGLGMVAIEENLSVPDDKENEWAYYRVLLNAAMTLADGKVARQYIQAFAPARSEIEGLDYTAHAHLYNDTITYDGTWGHGAA